MPRVSVLVVAHEAEHDDEHDDESDDSNSRQRPVGPGRRSREGPFGIASRRTERGEVWIGRVIIAKDVLFVGLEPRSRRLHWLLGFFRLVEQAKAPRRRIGRRRRNHETWVATTLKPSFLVATDFSHPKRNADQQQSQQHRQGNLDGGHDRSGITTSLWVARQVTIRIVVNPPALLEDVESATVINQGIARL